jgi:hypothetical protein
MGKRSRNQSQAEKRGPGRPPTGADPVIPVRLPADMIAAIAEVLDAAERETRADLIRASIDREIKRRRRTAGIPVG